MDLLISLLTNSLGENKESYDESQAKTWNEALSVSREHIYLEAALILRTWSNFSKL